MKLGGQTVQIGDGHVGGDAARSRLHDAWKLRQRHRENLLCKRCDELALVRRAREVSISVGTAACKDKSGLSVHMLLTSLDDDLLLGR